MPPFHDPLDVSLLKVTHKFHVRLKAHVTLMKPAVSKMPRKVSAKGYSRGVKQPKPFL